MAAKRVLLVDDEPFVLKLYQDGLARLGFAVRTASDGLGAMKELQEGRTDVLVLDLMMPRFNGAEVLRFIRTQPGLASLPVVVLSNAYMDDLVREAAIAGAQKALLKTRCTPAVLQRVINELLQGADAEEETSVLLAVQLNKPTYTGPLPVVAPDDPGGLPGAEPAGDAEFRAKVRADFLQNTASTCGALRQLFLAFTRAQTEAERRVRAQDVCRKVHFITSVAGLAGCARIAQMASVIEALLFDLIGRTTLVTPSVLRTLGLAIDFLEKLFVRESEAGPHAAVAATARILMVDDDAVSSRLLVSALHRAHLEAHSTHEPSVALLWLQQTPYDLVLLDIEMPGMDGFEVCRRLRALPGYEKIPVIFVTNHHDFNSRAQSALSGGNDLIAKPVLPMELAVKVLMHLLERA